MTILSSVFHSFFFSFDFSEIFSFVTKKISRKTLVSSLLERKKGGFAFLSDSLSLFSFLESIFYSHASKSVNQVSEDDEYSSHSSSRYVLRHSKLHLRPVRTLID